MKIMSVVGARPNFIKIAPFIRAIEDCNQKRESDIRLKNILVHTGQHYDDKMSRMFFSNLDISEPDINLGIGSGSHAEQVGRTMMAFEQIVRSVRPDWIVVVGDVNAACACSITAKKENVSLAHIEAGLRSYDMTMPEEVNRIVADRLSDLLFTPDPLSGDNLRSEGVAEEKIYCVGNIMIDTLEAQRKKVESLNIFQIIEQNIMPGSRGMHDERGTAPLADRPYILVTMHRPSNVDDPEILASVLDFLMNEAARDMPVLWPVHPRTVKRMKDFDLWEGVLGCSNLILMGPLGYLEFLRLNMQSKLMLTDSGGLQEECCVLGTPCLTLRWNTERPVTLKKYGGTCTLVGNDLQQIREAYYEALKTERRPARPHLWDGKTAGRIVQAIRKQCKNQMSP